MNRKLAGSLRARELVAFGARCGGRGVVKGGEGVTVAGAAGDPGRAIRSRPPAIEGRLNHDIRG
jgi:hypothetical protein